MEPQEKLTTQQFIVDRLHDVQRKVETGNIQDALDELKEVKAADSKNIYIIAIEKQILKLTDAATPADLRSEIVKSLPPMVERAINDSQRRLAEKAQEPKESKEKEAALEKLKSQYFQRADEYVEKGDYEHALEEIRRIYIIDPNNVVAKEYEQKIQQLASLKAKGETQEKATTQETPAAPAQKEQPVAETAEGEKGKSKLPLIAAAAVIILGIGVWFVLSSGSKEESQQPPATKEKQTVAAQQPSQQPTIVESTTPTTGKTKTETKPAETKSTPAPTQQPAQSKVEQKQPPRQEETPKPAASTPSVQQTPPQQQAPQPATTQPAQQPAQQPQPVATTPPADEGAAPKPFVVIESPPQIVRRETPKYPEIAYRMRMEGKVVIEVTVDPQGKPIQAKVARSSSDVFNEAAIEAAMKSTYKPAMMSTGPVTAKVYVPFDFKLR